MFRIPIGVIVAHDSKFGIAKGRDIPWHLKCDSFNFRRIFSILRDDMKMFAKITKSTQDPNKQNCVVMGRITWECIPSKFQPLPNRLNVVISRTITSLPEQVLNFPSFDDAINHLNCFESNHKIERIWAIGGSSIYKEAVSHDLCEKIVVTEVEGDFGCDVFFPSTYKDQFELTENDDLLSSEEHSEAKIIYRYRTFKRKPS